MNQIAVGNIPTHLSVRGQGVKTMLFVHGAGGNGHHFMSVDPPPGWRLVAVDLPGHGQSGGVATNDVFAYAEWLAECIREMGGCDIVGGHSMGGAITMSLALTNPELLRGIILIGTGAKLGVARDILDTCLSGPLIRIEELMGKYAYGPSVTIKQIQQWYRLFGTSTCSAYLQDFTACHHFDIRGRLAEITLPALIVCGLNDRLTPMKYSEYLAERLPDTQLVGIPDAGHMVMLEQPQAFNKAVAEFCRRF